MRKFQTLQMSVFLLSAACLFGMVAVQIVAQAPTDEWRRGIDAMVAEPGQAASILSNPAGIKTKEDRRGKKHEWITEIVSADSFMTKDTQKLVESFLSGDSDQLINRLTSSFKFLTDLSKLASGSAETSEETVDLLRGLGNNAYATLAAGTTVLAGKTPSTLTREDLVDALAAGDFDTVRTNLQNTSSLVNSLTDSFVKRFFDSLGDLGVSWYSRTLSLSHVNNNRPLAWGFYLGVEQKIVVRSNVESVSMPLSMTIQGIDLKADLPIGLQAYGVIPLRVAFAHDFKEALPGFTFGLGFKAVPYIGLNQTGLGRLISKIASDQGVNVSGNTIVNSLGQLSGINIGLDFGVQYHFGAIIPQLSFLHTGLKISDLIGFNVPFSEEGDEFRYALDFDWGVYAEHNLSKFLQVFGGFEIIQLRGMFKDGGSPYSALFSPVDHLRFLAGVGLFNNVLNITLQFYNRAFSPGIMLNFGPLQLNAALNFHAGSDVVSGLEFTLRFRGPHDGFNNKTPYKTYAQLATEKNAAKAAASDEAEAENEENSDEAAQTAEGT